MPCNLVFNSFDYDYCDTNLAGVKKIYVNSIDNVTITPDASNATATITLNNEQKFVELPFAKNTASYTSTLTKNENQGTRYYNTELVANINKLDKVKNKLFSGAGTGESATIGLDAGHLVIIVVDKNNINWLIGNDDYAMTTALTAQTGSDPDSGNFYTWTVTDQSARLPYTVADIENLIE